MNIKFHDPFDNKMKIKQEIKIKEQKQARERDKISWFDSGVARGVI